MTSLNLCIPYLHYVLLLNPLLFDKIFIDLIELFITPTGNRGLRFQLIPLVNPHLEPTLTGFQVHREQMLLLWVLRDSHHEGARAEDVTRGYLQEGGERGGAWEGVQEVGGVQGPWELEGWGWGAQLYWVLE
jgi:hypothetical protein